MIILFIWINTLFKRLPFLILFFFILRGDILSQEDPFHTQRRNMVKVQIKKRGITNPRVLEAMLRVKRHEFVPQDLRIFSYQDGPLPIGEGQTISQPYIVALMTELLNPQPEDRILEIGTGSGYQAAVLAEIVKEVYTIEIIRTLAETAKKNLDRLGYKNVKVKWGDGFLGWEEFSPFDKIIITCSVDDFPPELIKELKEGGRIVAPINNIFGYQDLVVGIKKGNRIVRKRSIPCRFVPATHKLR